MNRPTVLRRILTTDLPVLLMVVLAMGPFVWMILTSLTPSERLSATGVSLSPAGWGLDNYARLFEQTSFLGNMGHSLIVAVGTVLLGLAVSVTAAYAFSRFRFRGRKAIMLQFLLVNMFPVVLLILPLFVLMRRLGILDTHLGLIIANATVAIPFAVWMLTSYIGAIPKSLDEAATVDGAGWFRIYRSIIMPLSGPAIATVAILTFLPAWNQYLWPLMVVQTEELRPVMVGIDYFKQLNVSWGQIMAYATMITVPILVLFIAFQRSFINSIASSGVKG